MQLSDRTKLISLGVLLLASVLASTWLALELRQERLKLEDYQRLLATAEAEQEAQAKALEKNYLLGKFDPASREDFTLVPDRFNTGKYLIYLREETLTAFERMAAAAEQDGIKLYVASATRNFEYQKQIWENKWNGDTLVAGENLLENIPNEIERFQKILEYSAVPGTSRHHWGTDIDINGAFPEYFETFAGKRVYEWLVANAKNFGFCQVYNAKNSERQNGYHEEKWHWSYLPLARELTQEYENLISPDDLYGFAGDQYITNFDLINNYVLSINPECL